MSSSHSLPETQAALALSIFFATFIYEDGATLLAATLSASGSLDPRIGLLTTFLGIWVGDLGLYGLGSSFGRRTAQSRWLQKYLKPASLAKAEALHASREEISRRFTNWSVPTSVLFSSRCVGRSHRRLWSRKNFVRRSPRLWILFLRNTAPY